jgi:hypothetical protein
LIVDSEKLGQGDGFSLSTVNFERSTLQAADDPAGQAQISVAQAIKLLKANDQWALWSHTLAQQAAQQRQAEAAQARPAPQQVEALLAEVTRLLNE